jgi:hypothetical protein
VISWRRVATPVMRMQAVQLARPCSSALPSLTAPPVLCGSGRVFLAMRCWLHS